MINAFYDKYIFHHKIINWYKGFPVYTTMVPPMFSKTSANLMWNSMFASMFDKNIPFYVNIALTDKCNAKCPHCSFYWEDWIYDKNRKHLEKKDFIKVVVDLQNMWVSMIGFVWWEPLMNTDFEEILKSIDHEKTSTLLFTNWYFLEENLDMLSKNNLTSIAISIDSYDLKRHEELRWIKWLGNKIISSMNKVKKYDFNLAMSTYISPENIEDFPKYMDLAKDLWFHELILFPSFPSWKLSKKDIHKENRIEYLREMISMYNKRGDYPWIYWYSYVSSRESVWCQWWKKYLYISPYWDVTHCDFSKKTYWNILKNKIWDIYYKSAVENKDINTCGVLSPEILKNRLEEVKRSFNT